MGIFRAGAQPEDLATERLIDTNGHARPPIGLEELWWLLYTSQTDDFYTTLGGFMPLMAQLVLLFLLSAASLPDDVPPEGLDLRSFYSENSTYFWSLYATYVALVVFVRLADFMQNGLPPDTGIASAVAGVAFTVAIFILFVTLARTRSRRLHAVAVPLMIVLLLVQWWGLKLGPV